MTAARCTLYFPRVLSSSFLKLRILRGPLGATIGALGSHPGALGSHFSQAHEGQTT
jgi:hypothetical protein